MKKLFVLTIVVGLFTFTLFCNTLTAEAEDRIEKFDEFQRDSEAEWIFLWSSKDVSDKETDELIDAAEKIKNYRLYLIDFFAERVAELLVSGNNDLYDSEKIKELNNMIFECSRMDKNIRIEIKIRYHVRLKEKQKYNTNEKLAEKPHKLQ